MEFVVFEKHVGYCNIVINNPKQLNALNRAVLEDLDEAIEMAEKDSEVRCVIISGAGDKAFVAGADILAMKNMTVAEAQSFVKFGDKVFAHIEFMRKPVIAAIDGFTLGGGNELAMACDLRICSEKSKFGQPEVNLGIIPGFGGTQRMTRIVGRAQAILLILTGDTIDAQEALRIGLVDQVVPKEELLSTAVKLAEKLSLKPPYAIAQAIEAINYASGSSFAGYEYESSLLCSCFATDDQKEGMAAFLEKRKAEFTGK